MPWKLLRTEDLLITKDLAKSIAHMTPTPRERRIKPSLIEDHKKDILSGRFRPPHWAVASCLADGIPYRVNGQHTAHIYAEIADEAPPNSAHIEYYVCDTLADVAALHSTFDARRSARTASEIYCSTAATRHDLADIPKKIIECAASGIDGHMQDGTFSGANSRSTPNERAELLLRYPGFVVWARELISDTGSMLHMCRAGVFAAMFASWSLDRHCATTFWSLVRDESAPRPDDASRVLARWLLTTRHSKTMEERSKIKKADSREMYVASIHCWNAWVEGRTIKGIKYYKNSPIPKMLMPAR